jgi:predicted ATPase
MPRPYTFPSSQSEGRCSDPFRAAGAVAPASATDPPLERSAAASRLRDHGLLHLTRIALRRPLPKSAGFPFDEPEAPLSPARQLAFMARPREIVASDCQVIMATHSPLLLAFPGAAIWSFDAAPVARVRFDDLKRVRLTRDFLADPEAFLRHL